ncbi:hypothetical protein EJ04DRAFT_565003 [Polyplosphaeria fusca]|uniref:Uncharacterized protein n=1 Tax=Polyplosphaeria fusca TaxID=682080 RepID=A0A9P4UYW4_9PLEO|nr:hypothetical protein EJ04DRAFT_565003 [Polyplosphaeria fusca]
MELRHPINFIQYTALKNNNAFAWSRVINHRSRPRCLVPVEGKMRPTMRSTSISAATTNINFTSAMYTPPPRPATVSAAPTLHIKTVQRFRPGDKLEPPVVKHDFCQPLHGALRLKRKRKRNIDADANVEDEGGDEDAGQRLSKKRKELRDDILNNSEWVEKIGRDNCERRLEHLVPLDERGCAKEQLWQPPREIERIRRYLALDTSPLFQSERCLTDDEAAFEQWGLLPGETTEEVFEIDMDVQSRMRDGEDVIEALKEGENVVWREVNVPEVRPSVEVVGRRAWDQETGAFRAREGAVMDPRCRNIVGKVWGMAHCA